MTSSEDNVIAVCYQKSLEILRESLTESGFVASAATGHYAAVWARDACITTFGANISKDKKLLAGSKRTLETLSRLQSSLGQIPNVYWPLRNYWDWGEAGCTDASALFIIACFHYFKVTDDIVFVKKMWESLKKTYTWLRYQDANNFGLINSPEAGDWMDSTLNRSGKVLYINVLYYWAGVAMNEFATRLHTPHIIDTKEIKEKINLLFWPETKSDYSQLLRLVSYPQGADTAFPHTTSLNAFSEASDNRQYYISHVAYGKFVNRCDVLANLLAILYKITDTNQARKILAYLEIQKAAYPYPIKCWTEPEYFAKSTWGMHQKHVEQHQAKQWRNKPFTYHNGSIWPFIGGIYCITLWTQGLKSKAKYELLKLAQANKVGIKKDWEFHEWINPITGKPSGASYQAWNAGTFVMAYQAIQKNTTVI